MGIGQERMRPRPSGHPLVDLINRKTADLIDICETLKSHDSRLASLAMTHYENAAMWAVKCATIDGEPLSPV
jgi:hypothetical protein